MNCDNMNSHEKQLVNHILGNITEKFDTIDILRKGMWRLYVDLINNEEIKSEDRKKVFMSMVEQEFNKMF